MLAGCSQQGASQTATMGSVGQGILGSLRPKADPAVIQRMRAEEQAQAAAANQAKQQNEDGNGNEEHQSSSDATDISSRVLPKVSTDPIAPPAEEAQAADANGPIFSPSTPGMPGMPQFPGAPGVPAAAGYPSSPTMVATYSNTNVPPPPPGGNGGGLIPPPPAVTLSTQAQVGMPAGVPVDPNAMYNNPYMNPYANPYAIPYQYQQPQQAMPVAPPTRPSGSPFATPTKVAPESSDTSAQDARAKKNANFVPITPTGMESRSSYKQRDDLKVLWNGVLKGGAMSILMRDEKFSNELTHVEVGLPAESTKGSFGVSSRQVDAVFKNVTLDKRIIQPVKKLQSDMVQDYYRYLYSYNKFALAQQTVAARKQEIEVADSPSEKQRAAADLSRAQDEADSAKDDMRAAQTELASMAGPQATRFIIGKVSGITPTVESLGQADTTANAPQQQKSSGGGGGGALGMIGSVFGFGGHNKQAAAPAEATPPSEKTEAPKAVKVAEKKEKEKPVKDKDNKKDKVKGGGKEKVASAAATKEKTADLAPAPEAVVAASTEQAAPQSDISFELKNVNVTARKSILSVSIKNTGANNFSFSPDVFSISDGKTKLAEAAVRADFDQTLVQPNQEVKGTITIFGRPWSDRLAVVLSDGGKSIQMRR